MKRKELNELAASIIEKETAVFAESFSDDYKTQVTPDVLYGIVMECSAHVTISLLESLGLISVE